MTGLKNWAGNQSSSGPVPVIFQSQRLDFKTLLRLIGHREVGLDVEQLAEQLPKMGDEVLSTIGDNVSQGAMLCKNL